MLSSRPLTALLALLAITACSQRPESSHTADSGGRMSKDEVLQAFRDRSAGRTTPRTEALTDATMPPLVALSDLVGDAQPLGARDTSAPHIEATGDVDLTSFDTGIRSQGSRGWCTAFATIASMENLAKQKGRDLDLSEIHLWSTYGVYDASYALDAATKTYVVPETVWPYADANALKDLASNGIAKLKGYTQITTSVDDVAASLKAHHPVVLAIQISSTFQSDFYNQSGVISAGGSKTDMGHAIEVAGVQYSADAAGGGYFVLKNSWGQSGDHGYGYLPFKYCENFWCYAWSATDVDLK